jgi:hypothetical protein
MFGYKTNVSNTGRVLGDSLYMSKPPDDELCQDTVSLSQVKVRTSPRRLTDKLCVNFWKFVTADNLYISKPPNDVLYLSR